MLALENWRHWLEVAVNQSGPIWNAFIEPRNGIPDKSGGLYSYYYLLSNRAPRNCFLPLPSVPAVESPKEVWWSLGDFGLPHISMGFLIGLPSSNGESKTVSPSLWQFPLPVPHQKRKENGPLHHSAFGSLRSGDHRASSKSVFWLFQLSILVHSMFWTPLPVFTLVYCVDLVPFLLVCLAPAADFALNTHPLPLSWLRPHCLFQTFFSPQLVNCITLEIPCDGWPYTESQTKLKPAVVGQLTLVWQPFVFWWTQYKH